MARANPITYISADDPPFLIVHSDQDPLVNIRQSRIFHDALQKAKVDSRLHEVVGAGHGRFSDPKIAEMVHDFFAKCLAP